MLVNDTEAIKRLTSPTNLLNKMRSASVSAGSVNGNARASAMGLFGVGRSASGLNPEVKKEETSSVNQPLSAQSNTDNARIPELFVSKGSGSEGGSIAHSTFNPFAKGTDLQRFSSDGGSGIQVKQKVEDKESNPSVNDLMSNADQEIKLSLAHDSALSLLVSATQTLSREIDNIRPDKLPSVISAAAKTVDGIRRERNEASKNNKGGEVHYHFYTPVQKKISDYAVIEVN